jgi:hypothetical protein
MTIALVVVGGHLATAQHAQPSHPAPAATRAFSIESFRAFRNLMLQGDFNSKASLANIMAKQPTTGVGAVSGVRGEITILDGNLVVTYGKDNRPATKSDLMGMVTHGGERTHSHWVAMDGSETAHLNLWGIRAGTRLMLPKPE